MGCSSLHSYISTKRKYSARHMTIPHHKKEGLVTVPCCSCAQKFSHGLLLPLHQMQQHGEGGGSGGAAPTRGRSTCWQRKSRGRWRASAGRAKEAEGRGPVVAVASTVGTPPKRGACSCAPAVSGWSLVAYDH